ncbi:MAG: hypothetical protein Q9226_008316, partial [Calogaya cf. arnoldii]
MFRYTTGKRKAKEDPINDRYFQSNNPSKDASSNASNLTKLFDSYRGRLIPPNPLSSTQTLNPPIHADNPRDEPDTIGVEGSMRYLQDLGLSLDEPVVLAILTELGVPTMGELTRAGFIDGWKRLR